MKYVATFIALACLTGCTSKPPAPNAVNAPGASAAAKDKGHAGHAGMSMAKAGGTIMITTDPPTPQAGEKTTLKLMIHEPDGGMVKKFAELHTKLLHLIVIRKELDEFAHLHPDVDSSGNMTISHEFPVAGEYLLFADYKPAGKEAATAKGDIKVAGEITPSPPPLAPNVPVTVRQIGAGARVDVKDARAGQSATVTFQVIDEEERAVDDLQPYLGAMGHLVIVSADGEEYVHAHPLNETAAPGGVVEFMAHFPKSGIYKGWGQFQRSDIVYTVPFVVQVD